MQELPNDDSTPEASALSDFYTALQAFEGDVRDLKTVLAGLGDQSYGEGDRNAWHARVPFNEGQVKRSADRLLLCANALRALASRVRFQCPALDDLAKSLTERRPQVDSLIAVDETVLDRAQGETELLRQIVERPQGVRATINEDELAVHFNANHRRILKQMLRHGATEPAAKKTQKEIIPPPDDYNNFKREFSDLRRNGYLLPPPDEKTTRGRWLSEQGLRAAKWLEAKPDLD